MNGEKKMAGIAFLLKVGDDKTPKNYRTVAGLRENTMVIDERVVSISATGIFLGGDAEAEIRQRALDGTVTPVELSYETGKRLRGDMLMRRLDYAGDFNGERSYSIEMRSVGEMVPA